MLARFLASVRTLPRAIGAGGLLVLCPAMVAGCVLDREGRSLFSEDTVGATTGSGASGQGGGFTSNAASGSLGMTVSSSSAGAGPSAVCGDGQLNDAESCDDGNVVGGDGCSAECQIENGWMCQGQPSECAEPQTFSEDPTDKKVTKSYVGTIESMECFLFQMKIPETKLLKINATFDIETSKIGDVVIKIESPSKSTGT